MGSSGRYGATGRSQQQQQAPAAAAQYGGGYQQPAVEADPYQNAAQVMLTTILLRCNRSSVCLIQGGSKLHMHCLCLGYRLCAWAWSSPVAYCCSIGSGPVVTRADCHLSRTAPCACTANSSSSTGASFLAASLSLHRSMLVKQVAAGCRAVLLLMRQQTVIAPASRLLAARRYTCSKASLTLFQEQPQAV